MNKNIYVPPKKNQFALLSNDDENDNNCNDNNNISVETAKNVDNAKNDVVNVDNANIEHIDEKNNNDVDFKVYYSKKNNVSNSGPGQWSSSYQKHGGYQKHEGQPTHGGYQKHEGQPHGGYQKHEGQPHGGYQKHEGQWPYKKHDGPYQKHSENKTYEQLKYIYLEVPTNIAELKMNNYYRVLAHHNADSNWNYNSYHHVSTLKNWEDVPKLFNTLNVTNYKSNITNFDFFIMKNEISPLWEDEENRCGSICSVKIDTLKDGYNILKTIFINICNNTLMNISKNNVPNWNIINGVSFSCKKIENVSSAIEQDYSMIKIWFKTNYTQFDNIDKYFNDDINALLKKYSIKVRAIKPEY